MLGLINFLIEGVTDEGINNAWATIQDIVDNTVIPVIYAAIGLFLVVKGAILGMQIVKAADEPQVRQEKIGSLKWLVIGVAIAFGVVFLADTLMGYFQGVLGTTSTGTTSTGK